MNDAINDTQNDAIKYEIAMPSLGADMDQGKLLEWHIKPGDVINQGDLIAVVETQKAAVEIESFRSGTVTELIAQVGDLIPVGQTIARLELAAADGAAAAAVSPAPIAAAPATAAAPLTAAAPVTAAAIPVSPAASTSDPRVRISPAARRRASDLGLDLHSLSGTGRDGAIELHDVEQALIARANTTEAKPPASSPGPSLINVRAAIAQVMSRSKREIPHYYLQSQFCIDQLVSWLDSQNQHLPPEQRLFMPAVLMRAITLALTTNPALNGFYDHGQFSPSAAIHLGITVALKPDGVITPAILDAQDLSLSQFNSAFNNLVQRTRAGKLRNRELTDGTITVTNLGDLGADAVTGIIFAPQVALLGLGRIHKAPIVDGDGGLRAGWVIKVSLAADHRVSDGLAGSKLLNTLGRLFNQPEQLQ